MSTACVCGDFCIINFGDGVFSGVAELTCPLCALCRDVVADVAAVPYYNSDFERNLHALST